jgi:hypothetical protein
VKRGHRAEAFPQSGFQGDRWSSVVYDGDSGDWCNAYGCLHDLVGSEAENAVSSVACGVR